MDSTSSDLQYNRTRSTDFASPPTSALPCSQDKTLPMEPLPAFNAHEDSISVSLAYKPWLLFPEVWEGLCENVSTQILTKCYFTKPSSSLAASWCCRIWGHHLKRVFLLYFFFITTVNMNYLPVSSLSFHWHLIPPGDNDYFGSEIQM